MNPGKANDALELLRREYQEPRAEVLLEAANCVLQNRAQAYGTPESNFANIAALWNAYIAPALEANGELTAADVANMMALMKIGRLITNPVHADSWIDIAGYAACGYRAALKA